MTAGTPPDPHIAILMPVYNGGRFLEAQINSIAAQTHTAWTLYTKIGRAHV